MNNQVSNTPGELLTQRGIVSGSATLSPIPGRVRVTLEITIDEAYDMAYRCTSAHLAGFAGAVDQAAFWARWGRPVQLDLSNPTNGTVGIATKMTPDPGE